MSTQNIEVRNLSTAEPILADFYKRHSRNEVG